METETGVVTVNVFLEPREDGGLRVYSDDLPGLVLSGRSGARVRQDIPRAIEGILAYKFGAGLRVRRIGFGCMCRHPESARMVLRVAYEVEGLPMCAKDPVPVR
jgi:hypothetical protein